MGGGPNESQKPPPRVTKTTENMSKADSGAKMVLGGLEPADTYRNHWTPNFFHASKMLS